MIKKILPIFDINYSTVLCTFYIPLIKQFKPLMYISAQKGHAHQLIKYNKYY